ncbi:MAG: serine hydrolase domain-containing protein [Saprospiraceae bacterium]
MKYLFLYLIFLISNTLFAQADKTLDKEQLYHRIDSIMHLSLDSTVFPGAVVLVQQHGEVILERAYGFHTYDKKRPVQTDDIYDLASVTKTTAALPALMKLHGEGKFDLDAPLQRYFPSFKRSNKGNFTFREMLAHQARLKPHIGHWQRAQRKNGKYKWFTFKRDSSQRYPIRILDDLWLHRNYQRKMMKAIRQSDLLEKAEYRYSGLLFYLLPQIVERITGEDFVTYLNREFYEPLNAKTLTFNPLQKFPKERIIPTEEDIWWRKTLVHGTVHDEGAAMMGGVSSNAGLFSNAADLAKLLQLYLNGGEYEGKRYIKKESIAEFTKCAFCESGNRRGLGFDKPLIEYNAAQSYVAESASSESYGHSGFTGTFYWLDPAQDLIFILLSNRVYPTRENRKLYSLNIRPQLHQAVYDALINKL